MKSIVSGVDLVEADQVAEAASTIAVAEELAVVAVVQPNVVEGHQALMGPARDHVSISRPLNHLTVMQLNHPG